MHTYVEAGNQEDIAVGEKLIAAGKVGCIVLAGGDGSRLGWAGPKGSFPISLFKHKSLFQLLNERLVAASRHYHQELPLAIMTSPFNEKVTRAAFSERVDFFSQNMVPLLDREKKTLDALHPNGNGEVLKRFYESGLFAKWQKRGVEYLQVILVDNPLAEPFDPNQIGVHVNRGADLTLKAVRKQGPEEKVGVMGLKNGKLTVVEYSEKPPAEWMLANTSLFSFRMDFVETIKDVALPHHLIKKFVNGQPVYKRECFIFDLLPFAEKAEVILYAREATFAPLKSREDVGAVQRRLLERDKQVIAALTGHPAPDHLFELDVAFHFPSECLKEKWRNKPFLETGYVLP